MTIKVTVKEEWSNPCSKLLSTYIEDRLDRVFYGAGQIESMKDGINNTNRCLSNLLESLVEKRILSLKEIPKLLGNSDVLKREVEE